MTQEKVGSENSEVLASPELGSSCTGTKRGLRDTQRSEEMPWGSAPLPPRPAQGSALDSVCVKGGGGRGSWASYCLEMGNGCHQHGDLRGVRRHTGLQGKQKSYVIVLKEGHRHHIHRELIIISEGGNERSKRVRPAPGELRKRAQARRGRKAQSRESELVG